MNPLKTCENRFVRVKKKYRQDCAGRWNELNSRDLRLSEFIRTNMKLHGSTSASVKINDNDYLHYVKGNENDDIRNCSNNQMLSYFVEVKFILSLLHNPSWTIFYNVNEERERERKGKACCLRRIRRYYRIIESKYIGWTVWHVSNWILIAWKFSLVVHFENFFYFHFV